MIDTLVVLVDSIAMRERESSHLFGLEPKDYISILGYFFGLCLAVLGLCWLIVKDRIKANFEADLAERKELHKLCHDQIEELMELVANDEFVWYSNENIDKLLSLSKALDARSYYAAQDIANKANILRQFLLSYNGCFRHKSFHDRYLGRLYYHWILEIRTDCIKKSPYPTIWKVAISALRMFDWSGVKRFFSKRVDDLVEIASHDVKEDKVISRGVYYKEFDESLIAFCELIHLRDEPDFAYALSKLLVDQKIISFFAAEEKLILPIYIRSRPVGNSYRLFHFVSQNHVGPMTEEYVKMYYSREDPMVKTRDGKPILLEGDVLRCEHFGEFGKLKDLQPKLQTERFGFSMEIQRSKLSCHYQAKSRMLQRYLKSFSV